MRKAVLVLPPIEALPPLPWASTPAWAPSVQRSPSRGLGFRRGSRGCTVQNPIFCLYFVAPHATPKCDGKMMFSVRTPLKPQKT